MLALYLLVKIIYILISGIALKIRVVCLLENVSTKRDLLYMNTRDFENVIAEIFRRNNHKVELTSVFGEGGNGIILDNIYYLQVRKDAFNHRVNTEKVKKFVKSMQLNSIYRGIFITLGDFCLSTRYYCHKNSITCINGDELFCMCKEVQVKRDLKKRAGNV